MALGREEAVKGDPRSKYKLGVEYAVDDGDSEFRISFF
jgi:hypothetical protein